MLSVSSLKNFFYSQNRENARQFLSLFAFEFFQNALFFYLFFYLLEFFQPGRVSRYFPLNILLFSVLAAGLLVAIFPHNQSQKFSFRRKTVSHFVWVGILIIFNLLVFNKLKALGSVALLVLCASIIFSSAILFEVISEKND
ncbi:hypothetical protein C4546_03015 [Candidatus Parcubacteria bacterium]|jgi:hypothetical protein|nr:MAG: hypothetical protein C4546_03015 [Candidatus Parcubacteria bacterium]